MKYVLPVKLEEFSGTGKKSFKCWWKSMIYTYNSPELSEFVSIAMQLYYYSAC